MTGHVAILGLKLNERGEGGRVEEVQEAPQLAHEVTHFEQEQEYA